MTYMLKDRTSRFTEVIPTGIFCGGDRVPDGTFHGGDKLPDGSFH